MGMATAQSRRDDKQMDLLATIERAYAENERDMAAIMALAKRMRQRTRLQAVYVSRATGSTLLLMAQRTGETLPHVPERKLR